MNNSIDKNRWTPTSEALCRMSCYIPVLIEEWLRFTPTNQVRGDVTIEVDIANTT